LYSIGTDRQKVLKTEITIGKPKNRKQLKEEVEKAEFLGYTNNGKKIILADARHSPFLISELGRVREISFRAIGGGTGTARDNDAFDNHYKHLILWDDDDLEIVGAYRIGECKQIIQDRGQEGLYTSNLCHFNELFKEYCGNSVELGRSFVQPKYWGSRAFDSLWQAVTVYLAHNPHIQYTYGVVTINADTPQQAVAALVYFYTHHFACETKMMTAKQPYIMSKENQEKFDKLFKHLSYKEGFIVLKRYLKDLGTVVPTLFKQYIELYEEGAVRYFDFSVNDGLFGVTEGFIISDNYRMKKSVQERNLKEFNKNLIDPIKLTFDSKVYGKTIEEIIESESIRQMDKSNSNNIGYFQQNIFKYIYNQNTRQTNWSVPKQGFDIVNDIDKIYVEMKNKHNTMNSSSSQKTYMRMSSKLNNMPEATCMLVEVIAKNSQNIPWKISLDGEPISHNNIRRVSIDKFYEIVTGEKEAFKQLVEALPKVMDDVLEEIQQNGMENTVFEELRGIDENILKSLYLLSFQRYEGFESIDI
ncbi:Eco47II family restriction endonuclease, partial [Sulfurimonas sp.]|uniref:Eco47II family restriction endonuclease n=1 Tax=Sulfurimonas sp. TaxID=2022749 RepID=UPI002626C0B4